MRVALHFQKLSFSSHALRRMFERRIGVEQVRSVIESGQVIANYSEDTPFPSCLILGYLEGRPLHVVAGFDEGSEACVVVTVYVPDRGLWDTDFKTRKAP